MSDLSNRLRDRLTAEHALLVGFLVVSLWMLQGTRDLSAEAAIFPRLLSATVAILAAMILFRSYLPGPLRTFVDEPVAMLDDAGDPDSAVEAAEKGESEEAAGAYTYDIDDAEGPVVTALLCVGYLVGALTIGLLWSTPLFVAAYAYWAGMDRYRGTALVVLSLGTAFAFVVVLNVPAEAGLYTGWRLVP